MKRKEILDLISCDSLSKNKAGNWVARKEFFYTNGRTADGYASTIYRDITNGKGNVVILDQGEVWKPFKGGAPVSKQSHWWVEFKIIENDKNQ